MSGLHSKNPHKHEFTVKSGMEKLPYHRKNAILFYVTFGRFGYRIKTKNDLCANCRQSSTVEIRCKDKISSICPLCASSNYFRFVKTFFGKMLIEIPKEDPEEESV